MGRNVSSAAAALMLAVCIGQGVSEAVRPRARAPAFKANSVMPDQSFNQLQLEDYVGKWVVLFFYPFDFTFVCPTELVAFSDSVPDFRAMNTEVLAVSTDSVHTHLAWIRTKRSDGGVGSLNIPLVADVSKDISRSYGVLVEDQDDAMYGAALRGLFIIDPTGVVRSVQINDDSVGRSVKETVRLVKAFQFADSHEGEACPANWEPGSDTIKTSHEAKTEFFKRAFGSE